jgi:diguanylate cyclase (GGDEF)-like protein
LPFSTPAPVPLTPPKRWPWLLSAFVAGILAIGVLVALHAREQRAERAETQATLFAAELRDSVRELTLFGYAVPESRLVPAMRPVIASTVHVAEARLDRLAEVLGEGDADVARLRAQLQEIGRLNAGTDDPKAFGERLGAAAEWAARTADGVADAQQERAAVAGRESIGGGVAAVLFGILIVTLVLRRVQRVLVAAERRQAVQLKDLAERDPLTGLANRRRLGDDLARLAAHATPDRPVQVLICDLDGFKALNDSLGHEAGDDLLVAFAVHLQEATADAGQAYRLGGDEFCVLSRPGLDVAGRVRRVLAGDADGRVRGSAGLALWPADAPTARDAMRLADERMYAAKARRRSTAA